MTFTDMCVCYSLSCVRFFVTPWIVVHQVPLSVEFSGQEYWSGLPCPSPGDLPDAGIEPGSPMLQVYSLLPEQPGNLLGSERGLKEIIASPKTPNKTL